MVDPLEAPVPPAETEVATKPTDAEVVDDDDVPAEESAMVSEPADDNDPEGVALPPLPAALPPRFRWNASVTLRGSYDDNILLSSTHRESDEITALKANIGLAFGDYIERQESFLTIHYAPSFLLFTDHSKYNGFEQEGTLIGQWRLAKLTLGALAGIQTIIGGDVDVGARANRTVYRLALTAKYALTDKLSFEEALSQNRTDYQAYLGSVDWMSESWIDYRIFPKARIGAGLVLGYLSPEGGVNQTYEQALLRLTEPASDKLTFTMNGGLESRQFAGSSRNLVTPIFAVNAIYEPFAGTIISLEAARRTYSSALEAGQDYIATRLSASVRQRFFRRFFATLSGGWEEASYESAGGLSTSRQDRFIVARGGVSYALTTKTNFELFYQYRSNDSNAPSLSFKDNITGVRATLGF